MIQAGFDDPAECPDCLRCVTRCNRQHCAVRRLNRILQKPNAACPAHASGSVGRLLEIARTAGFGPPAGRRRWCQPSCSLLENLPNESQDSVLAVADRRRGRMVQSRRSGLRFPPAHGRLLRADLLRSRADLLHARTDLLRSRADLLRPLWRSLLWSSSWPVAPLFASPRPPRLLPASRLLRRWAHLRVWLLSKCRRSVFVG